jgi:hypothetical protein
MTETLPPDLAACLPSSGPLHRYMTWAVKTTDAEPLFHLGAILPCFASEAATHGVLIDEAHRIVPRVWSFMVGVPASSKSTAMKRAMGLYRTHVASQGLVDPFVIAEGSVPGIFEALCDKHNTDRNLSLGIVYRDEAARLLDTKDSVGDMLCNIIDGETVKRHLRGVRSANREAPGSVRDTLHAPAFSGILTTTFSRLREVTKPSHLEGGLYSRFLWFVGQPRLVGQSMTFDPHRDEERDVANAWGDWSKWLLGQEVLGHALTVQVPRDVVELLRATLFTSLEEHGKTDNRLNAARKRGLSQAMQIAGLYALSQHRLVANAEDMDAAINLVELCLAGLERVEPSLAVDEFMQAADFAFHAIAGASPTGMPVSRLYSVLRRAKPFVDGIVETLVAEGSVRLSDPIRTGKPGRPSRVLVACGPMRYAGDPDAEPVARVEADVN